MLHGQPNIRPEVNRKTEDIHRPSTNLVAEIAEKERRDGLHDLVGCHAEVDVGDGAGVLGCDGGDGREVDGGGEGGEEGREDGHYDEEHFDAGGED